MGLIRNAAIVAIGITLIPADPQDRAALYAKVQNGVHWAATFCDRNERTCAHGAEMRDAFIEKASFAAASAYEIALTRMTGDERAGEVSELPGRTYGARPAVGTLRDDDLRTAWRGPR